MNFHSVQLSVVKDPHYRTPIIITVALLGKCRNDWVSLEIKLWTCHWGVQLKYSRWKHATALAYWYFNISVLWYTSGGKGQIASSPLAFQSKAVSRKSVYGVSAISIPVTKSCSGKLLIFQRERLQVNVSMKPRQSSIKILKHVKQGS